MYLVFHDNDLETVFLRYWYDIASIYVNIALVGWALDEKGGTDFRYLKCSLKGPSAVEMQGGP